MVSLVVFFFRPLGWRCNDVDLYRKCGYNNELNVHVLWFSFDLR